MDHPTAMGSLLQAFHKTHECGKGGRGGERCEVEATGRSMGTTVFLLL